jgi:hypothetical protein
MKRLLLPLIAALALPTAVSAEVDPKVHKLCLPAADYQGCIKAQTTKPTDIPSIRVIQGKTELTGNSCPTGYAYAGAGKCRDIEVYEGGTWTMPALSTRWAAGSRAIDSIALWRSGLVEKPRDHVFHKFGTSTNAVYDPKCPDSEPIIYTTSSCAERPTAPSPAELKSFFKGPAFVNKKELFDFWDKALEDLYGVKGLATAARNLRSSIPIQCKNGVWKKNHPQCKKAGVTSSMDMD